MSNIPDKRHFTRIPFDANITLTDPASGQSWQSALLDISLKGILIASPAEWQGKPEQAFDVELHLSGAVDGIKLHMEVRVAHIENNHVGFKCEHMDLDSATHLHRLVELNLGDEKLLERELGELIAESK